MLNAAKIKASKQKRTFNRRANAERLMVGGDELS